MCQYLIHCNLTFVEWPLNFNLIFCVFQLKNSKRNFDNSRLLNALMNSGIEIIDEMIDQNMRDIIQISQESLIDSFKSMETVIRYKYSTDIIEESYMLKDEIKSILGNYNYSSKMLR
ncbi:Signal recognition particleprotein [Dirofilaria immitis]